MSDRTPHLNRLLIFIIIILCLICGLLFTQSSAGPFGNSHTSVIAENTGDIAVLSSDKDQNIKLNIYLVPTSLFHLLPLHLQPLSKNRMQKMFLLKRKVEPGQQMEQTGNLW